MINKTKTLNKTVAKFVHKGIKYEVDMLLDTKYGDEGAATPGYKFHILDITDNNLVGEFDGYDGVDYIVKESNKMINKIKILLKCGLAKCYFRHKRIWPSQEWIGMDKGQTHFDCYNSWEHGR